MKSKSQISELQSEVSMSMRLGLLYFSHTPSGSGWACLPCGSRGTHCGPHDLSPASWKAAAPPWLVEWWSSLWNFAEKHTPAGCCYEFHWAGKPGRFTVVTGWEVSENCIAQLSFHILGLNMVIFLIIGDIHSFGTSASFTLDFSLAYECHCEMQSLERRIYSLILILNLLSIFIIYIKRKNTPLNYMGPQVWKSKHNF